jgi:ABC-type amino acid transport substrate-binding protein
MAGLRAGDYDAFSTDLPILAGFEPADDLASDQERFEILDLAIADTSEKIGIAVPDGDQALRKLVAYFLHQWQTGPVVASPWLRAYDDTIGTDRAGRMGNRQRAGTTSGCDGVAR